MSNDPQQHRPTHHGHQSPKANPYSPEQSPMGRPMQDPLYAGASEPVHKPPNRLLIAVIGVSLLIAGAGVVKKFAFPPDPASAAPVVRQPSPWQEQQQFMRDAMDMAREAQQMQRENQENMRRAMEMEFDGEFPEEDW